MDISTDGYIIHILEFYCKKFYTAVLNDDEDFYEKYKSMDRNDKFNNFIYTIINDNDTFVKYHKLLINSGCDRKELNKFFYTYFKMREKSIKKKFSFAEIEEFEIDDFDIDIDNKYKFF